MPHHTNRREFIGWSSTTLATAAALSPRRAAAQAMNVQIDFLEASTADEIDAAFNTVARQQFDALFVDLVPFFTSRRAQFADLASRHRVPVIYGHRQFAEVGGLMSYGPNLAEAWYQCGRYAGGLLGGSKVAEMPVMQLSKFELVINLRAAKSLGLALPDKLIALADEVVE